MTDFYGPNQDAAALVFNALLPGVTIRHRGRRLEIVKGPHLTGGPAFLVWQVQARNLDTGHQVFLSYEAIVTAFDRDHQLSF